MAEHKYNNALIHASSPYLLQHAHNPVNWQEWSPAILEQARREDKLILISIGYSSCHWCHVMEKECFEQEDTAAIMNAHFICVKIDREERPDIDQVYMDAVQLLTGRGGWPLNVFTLPDGRPLHGGTYFPKAEWERVLISLSRFYEDKRTEAYEFATNLSNGIRKLDQFQANDKEVNLYADMMGLLNKWKQQFDLTLGGYTWSPKFPLPNQWELFMGIHFLSKDPVFKNASMLTLHKMYAGGIFDHLAGGFARYSTDSFWKVPHFEKMLYDNAQLMGTYALAAAYFQEAEFAQVVEEIHGFISTEMRSPEGLFYSALDADSEGVEGKYYVWTADELQNLLGEKAAMFAAYYSVLPDGNWEEGVNILYRGTERKTLCEKFKLSEQEYMEIILQCKKILLPERSKRIAPGLDDKIICSWNALMISGYAKAYLHTGKEIYLQEAQHAMDQLLSRILDQKQIFRIYKNGKKSIAGFAEDYACLITALIQLYEAGNQEKYILLAHELMEECILQFYDPESSLFFFSSVKQDVLVTRKIEVNDDVIPSSNSMLANCLYKLSYYFERSDYEEKYQKMLQAIAGKMKKFPNGFSNWMQLISCIEGGFTQIVLSGPEAEVWAKELRKSFRFNTAILVKNPGSSIPLLHEKENPPGQTQLWICTDKTCGLPLRSLDEIG